MGSSEARGLPSYHEGAVAGGGGLYAVTLVGHIVAWELQAFYQFGIYILTHNLDQSSISFGIMIMKFRLCLQHELYFGY